MKHEPLFAVLTEIIEAVCRDHLEDTRIYPERVDGVETLTVIPHMADYPKLIGKSGAQVKALNYLVQHAARRLGVRLRVNIEESFIGSREPIEPFAYDPKFDVEAFKDVLTRLTNVVAGNTIKFDVIERDAMIVCRYLCERSSENEAVGSAISSVLRPYCFRLGRSLYIKPQFINHETNPELLRHG